MPCLIVNHLSQLKAKYALEDATQVVVDQEAIEELGVSPVLGDYLDEGEVARHATDRIARDLMDLAAQASSNERPSSKRHTTSS